MERQDNDGAHKFAFGVPEVFADLLRLVFPEWAGALDFDNADEVSAEHWSALFRRHPHICVK